MAQDCAGDDTDQLAFVPALRSGGAEDQALLTALAGLHTRGLDVDWSALFTGASRVDLPTYAFQRQRYWLEAVAGADVTGAGLADPGHPLLGAVTSVPGSGLVVASGVLSLRAQPWLADHVVAGSVVVPGAALVEMAVRVGDEVGAGVVEELVIEAPLVLAERGSLRVQVVVDGVDGAGRFPVAVYSAEGDGEWVRHASGFLAAGPAGSEPVAEGGVWPPAGAVEVEVEGFYQSRAEAGLAYGPVFRGLERAWTLNGEVYAEVALPEAVAAEGFALHPALLDAALHAGEFLEGRAGGGVLLPFAWSDVAVHASGAVAARVRITARGADGFSVEAADRAGNPVASVGRLTLRELTGDLSARRSDALYRVDWTPLPLEGSVAGAADIALVDLTDGGELRPLTARALDALQEFLAAESGGRLVVLTRGVTEDPAVSAVWGLVRSAQSENPGRLVLVDTDEVSRPLLDAALATGEPQLLLREATAAVPRLVRADHGQELPVPAGAEAWHLDVTERGTLENLALLPDTVRPLAAGELRIAVRAAGVNFRDVLIALGMYPGDATLGGEGAGVVLEVGPGVTGLAPGDRVMGLLANGFGPQTVADRRNLVRMPAGWSFAQAASVPLVFVTAYYGLRDRGGLSAGESVLVHAAAGGVGSAAVQLARHFGATVFGTASTGKWDALRAAGLDDEHIGNSRTLEFRERFLAATGGRGVDVVLDALAGEFVDASLDLLPRGGRFLEMGKTDIRDADEVAAARPGVAYQAFDLVEAGPDRVQEILLELVELFERGVLTPLPLKSWDVRRAPDAFRHLSQARHVGKVVLTVPRPLDPEGTALVSGLGTLGALVARHLVTEHGVRHLVLTSRRGRAGAGADELVAELTGLGAAVTVAACDTADREAVAAVLAGIPAEHPLTAVVHTAGVVDDGVLSALTPQRLDTVFRPKADAVHTLDELTRDADLAAFVVFSSAAGVLGNPGQGNYAAANAYLDGLAARIGAEGRPAVALAWGFWAEASTMTADLDTATLQRNKRDGMVGIGAEEGMALFDLGLGSAVPALVPAKFDLAALRARATAEPLPALLRGLVRSGRQAASNTAATTGASVADQLAGLSADDQERFLLDLVRRHAATVLGHASGDSIEAGRAFKEAGFDSLTAVELRNRLTGPTGVRLPATLVFDYPTPLVLAKHLRSELVGDTAAAPAPAPVAVTAGTDEPIAIVAMSCRFPGEVNSPEELWELLLQGADVMSGFPTNRGWDLERLFDADPERLGTSYVSRGAFLHDAGEFDAEFFGISPREALAMDPQQRLLLEASWEAVERAGIDPATLRGSATGVFTGLISHDYAHGMHHSGAELEGYRLTGAAGSVASGRVSYVLGLEGPAISVDTACSSSLVSLHMAVQALRQGEISMALAGGVMVMATPDTFVEFSRQRGLATDGRIKAFAGAADGTAWSEGIGVLVVERLSDARRLGHPVLAVVRGSAVNQDGASNGLSAPNGPSQQRVIRQALANARLTAADVDAVEAHGTGTTLGDPIEAQALLATYGQDRSGDQPLWLGSIKSNIGHAQGAAGVASVIKMVLALRHGVLPKTLHVDEPSPKVDWSAGAVELLTEARAWPRTGRPRRAGVSSFGVSGTNAHVILEQAPVDGPQDAEVAPGTPADAPLPWLLSAKSAAALRGQAARLAAFVEADPAVRPADIAHSLVTTRAALDVRAAVVPGSRGDAVAALTALAAGESAPNLVTGTAGVDGRTVFVFPGQGSQWVGMGAELLETSPVFAARMAECAEALSAHVDWSLLDVIRQAEGAPSLDRVDVVQPVSFAMMVSLAEVWRFHGVVPDAVIGHSQGEIAASCVAGVLSLADATKVVALRSQAIAAGLAGKGGMMSVALPAAEVEHRLGDGLELAAVNGPGSAVVAGEPAALDALYEELVAEGVRARKVPVDYASHTSHVELIEAELAELLDGLSPRTARIPLFSTVLGRWLDGSEMDGGYWYRNLRSTVRFAEATDALLAQGHRVFVEVSAHPVLTMAIQDLADQRGGATAVTVGSLRRDDGGLDRLLLSLAELLVRGVEVDSAALFAGARRVDLPTYAFQREWFWWAESVVAGDAAAFGLVAAEHPLLGAVTSVPGSGLVVASGVLSLRSQPWLADHVVAGSVVVPGAALVELAVRVGDEVGAGVVEELVIEAPLVLAERGSLRVQVVVDGVDGAGRFPVALYSAEGDGEWVRHASGFLAAGRVGAEPVAEGGVWPPAGAVEAELEGFYRERAGAGLEYGPLFQGLHRVWTLDGEVYAEVALPEGSVAEGFALHPALLDAALHAGVFLTGWSGGGVLLPFAWSDVAVHATGADAVRVRISARGGDGFRIEVADEAGAPVVSVGRLTLRELTGGLSARRSDALFRVDWTPLPLEGSVAGAADVALVDLTDGGEVRPLTARALDALQGFLAAESGGRLVVLTRGVTEDPAVSAVWGLVRSAQSENPGRIVLVDVDEASSGLVDAALASGESQVLLREGGAAVPRLVRVERAAGEGVPDFDPEGTVLVSGLGTLGALVARHLVAVHGVSRLLLTSRRGAEGVGVAELVAELSALGASVRVEACDMADRGAVAGLLAGVSVEHPLTGVVHTAGVLDDALVGSLSVERLDAVFRPKVDAALNLDELTRGSGLAAFVLFSSAAGTFGTPGQGNYAAANAFLDGLAVRRRRQGLPATSLAWGLWAEHTGMTSHLDSVDLRRSRRGGMLGLSNDEGVLLFDAALASGAPALVPARLDLAALNRGAGSEPVPPLLRGLVRPGRRTAAQSGGATGADTLARRLTALPEDERAEFVLELVTGLVATVLGRSRSTGIDPGQAFKDVGFDSLLAVELRNRLVEATGVRLAATLVFDYATPAALARHLESLLVPEAAEARAEARPWAVDEPAADEDDIDLGSASDDELFDLIDSELGHS
ncbi:SDR family NAD(P)-dependent oxidoreductase [Kitasatospora sp. NPDC059327]|uniref:SDR family NAD(P)-dependent oxidoreductase n=1 Tax=Kitasatospora sp. NPDC059327 TaxID=3346803 RepID=UPI0036C42C74